MVERYRSEDRARACRAIDIRAPRRKVMTSVVNAARVLTRAAFTTLVMTLRRGERMSIALETRGLGAGPRTIFRPVPLDHRDGAFALVVLAAVGAVLLLAWRAGWLAGWGALGVFG